MRIDSPKISNLTTNGFIKTISSDGTLQVDTTNYLPSALVSTHIFVGNGSGIAADVALSGDVSILSTGAATVTGIKGFSVPTLAVGYLKYTGSNWIFDNTFGTMAYATIGTANYIPKFTASNVANSLLYDDGTHILIGATVGNAAKLTIYNGTSDAHLQLAGTAPSIRFNDTVSAGTFNGFIGMSSGVNNFITGSVFGDMVIGNQNNGDIIFGFGAGTAVAKMRISAAGLITAVSSSFSGSSTAASFINSTSSDLYFLLGGGGTVLKSSYSLVTGSSSIVTVGIITAGEWRGTAIADTWIASSGNWNTAYTNRITSLTVTGSSGVATLVTNTLNIPTYTLSGLGGQPLATNLTSLSVLSYASTSFVKMTAAGTFALDTNTYLTANQAITLSGDVSGSGTTSITTTLASIITAGGPTGSSSVVPVITYDAKGRLTAVSTATITPASIGASPLAGSSSITTVGTLSSGSIPYSLLTGTPSLNYLPLAAGSGSPLTGDLYLTNSSADRGIYTNETNTGTHALHIQAGGGSAAYGGSIHFYANAHATKRGDVAIGLSAVAGAQFRVNTTGVDNGGDIFILDRATGALTLGSTALTGIGAFYAGAITASSSITATSGFIKSGYTDSYFLLAGGGTTATSNYAAASSLASYLPLAGGTMISGATVNMKGNDPANGYISLNNSLSTGNKTYRIVAGLTGQSQDGFSIYDATVSLTRLGISLSGTVTLGNADGVGTGALYSGAITSSSSITNNGNYLIANSAVSEKGYTFNSPASNWSPQTSGLYFSPADGVNAATTFRIALWDGTASTNTVLSIAPNKTVSIPSTTASTSTTTGALVVSGGVGVAGALYVGGSVTATGFFNTSDGTLKNILSRDGDVVYFNWKDKRDNLLHIGYIAQEVRDSYPDQINVGSDGYLSVNYTEVLVDKVRRLERRVEELEKQLTL